MIVSKLFQPPILGQAIFNPFILVAQIEVLGFSTVLGSVAPTPELFKCQLFMDLAIIYIANYFYGLCISLH